MNHSGMAFNPGIVWCFVDYTCSPCLQSQVMVGPCARMRGTRRWPRMRVGTCGCGLDRRLAVWAQCRASLAMHALMFCLHVCPCGYARDKDGLLQSNGNTICVLDRMRESAPPRPKVDSELSCNAGVR